MSAVNILIVVIHRTVATYSNNLRFTMDVDSDIWVLIVNYMIYIAYQILR